MDLESGDNELHPGGHYAIRGQIGEEDWIQKVPRRPEEKRTER
jgi:hypothetical protein